MSNSATLASLNHELSQAITSHKKILFAYHAQTRSLWSLVRQQVYGSMLKVIKLRATHLSYIFAEKQKIRKLISGFAREII